jgi:hypothetical protein
MKQHHNKSFISESWSLVLHSIWLHHHNEYLHGLLTQPLYSIKHLHLLSEISALYNLAPHIMHPACLQPIAFDYPVSDCKKHHSTASLLQNFLLFAKPIVTHSVKEASDIGSTPHQWLLWSLFLSSPRTLGYHSFTCQVYCRWTWLVMHGILSMLPLSP